MATVLKRCRRCGKEYEYCHTAKQRLDAFRWQDVACSPACGEAYFAAVLASRAGTAPGGASFCETPAEPVPPADDVSKVPRLHFEVESKVSKLHYGGVFVALKSQDETAAHDGGAAFESDEGDGWYLDDADEDDAD